MINLAGNKVGNVRFHAATKWTLSQDSNVKRGRGRPKLNWVEAIKGDLKGWNIPKDLALDRSAWKTTIHVPEPWLLLLGFNSSLPQFVWDLKVLLLLLSSKICIDQFIRLCIPWKVLQGPSSLKVFVVVVVYDYKHMIIW